MHPVLIEIGPFEIRFYGLMYILALTLSYFLLRADLKRKGIEIEKEELLNLLTFTVLGGIIGARIYYVIFNWDFYGKNFADIPAIWKGGLASHGGFIGGFIVAYVYLKKLKLPILKMADSIIPLVILGEACVRFGNFMNGEAHGVPTDLPWGIIFPETSIAGSQFPGIPIHPTMLYQMFYNLLAFSVIWFYLRKKDYKDGLICFTGILIYSLGRFFIEALRADSLYIGPFRTAQLMSIVLTLISVIMFLKIRPWVK